MVLNTLLTFDGILFTIKQTNTLALELFYKYFTFILWIGSYTTNNIFITTLSFLISKFSNKDIVYSFITHMLNFEIVLDYMTIEGTLYRIAQNLY